MDELVIRTENLREYRTLFNSISDKKAGVEGAVHLDFKEGIFSFRGPGAFFKTALYFQESDIEIDGVYVMEGEKFFAMIQNYDEVFFNGKIFTTEDGNRFHLNMLEGPGEYPHFEEGDDYIEAPFNYEELKTPLYQIGNFLNDPKDGQIFFHNDEMLAVYENNLVRLRNYFSTEEDFSLPTKLFSIVEKLQSAMKNSPTLRMYKKEDSVLVHYSDEEDEKWNSLHYSLPANVDFPVDPDDPEFIENYDNEHFITVNGENFMNTLTFLDPFATGINNDTAYIKMQAKEGKMLFYISDDSNSVEYNLPVEEFSDVDYFEQESMDISFKKLKNTLKALRIPISQEVNSWSVTMKYNVDGPTVTFSSSSHPNDIFVRTTTE